MQMSVITYASADDHVHIRDYLTTLEDMGVNTIKFRDKWNKILSIANEPEDYPIMVDELYRFRLHLEDEIMPKHAPKNTMFDTRNGITAYWPKDIE